MKIVLVEPGKEARPAEISGSLQSMQQLVGGIIQAIYPWTDPVAMICHDEGKILGLPFNRVLEDYDLIAGPFFICGIQGENFASLTDRQIKTYLEKFRQPQITQRNLLPKGTPTNCATSSPTVCWMPVFLMTPFPVWPVRSWFPAGTSSSPEKSPVCGNRRFLELPGKYWPVWAMIPDILSSSL